MGNGRKARAPCGHWGETVIGTYVQCPKCDKHSVPTAVAPEKTEPMRVPRCPGCSSSDIERFSTDIDAAIWYLSNHLIPSGSPTPPDAGEWGCNSCAKIWPGP